MSQPTTLVESPVVDNNDVSSARPAPDGPEEALESHQIIELQTFIERKAWIEEKIKLLEKMPPIEVFVGLDALEVSAEEVPGLPSRSELQQWLVEHDTTEKETEIFDTGELKKLRNFTRAATQRNLSPEDTDLIELTLTTIYELDKLLHLLRDRSENLDLLGVRLTWEEHRSASWRERRNIIADLNAFLDQRARWSKSVYSRDVSQSGEADDPLSSPAFSKTTRHGFADNLSRDAAQFTSRVSNLRHGSITSAGKVLDKLIDNSRKPVPDVLLDEQDRLEERGINDMENVGKFVMNAVMQWRKADEIYVETLKDQENAKALIAEVKAAQAQHPDPHLSTAFTTRADGLSRRLTIRGNPVSRGSSFPCPVHPLFPEQETSNSSIARQLSSEINTTSALLNNARTLVDEYRTRSEAIQRVESLMKSAETHSNQFVSIIDRFENGVPSTDGDGTPPNLTSKACLEPTRHSDFLALLTTLKDEALKTEAAAEQLLKNMPGAMLRLDFPGVEPAFKAKASSTMQRLSSLLMQSKSVRNDVIARAGRLRESRKIWEAVSHLLKDMDSIRREIGSAMEFARWKDDSPQRSGAPPTPESPNSIPLPTSSSQEISQHLTDLSGKIAGTIDAPLASLRSTLEAPLLDHLEHGAAGLRSILSQLRQMAQLLESLKAQSSAMTNVRSDYHDIQLRIENLKIVYSEHISQILNGSLAGSDLDATIVDLGQSLSEIRSDASTFISGLSQRLPFVSANDGTAKFIRRPFSSFDLKLGFSERQPIEVPFDLQVVDDSVRSTSNTIVMRLNGDLYGLEQKTKHLALSRLAKELDVSLSKISEKINTVISETSHASGSFSSDMDDSNRLDDLEKLLNRVEELLKADHSSISRSFSPLRSILARMEEHTDSLDPIVRDTLFIARSKAVDDAKLKFTSWDELTRSLISRIAEARATEQRRLEELERAEAARIRREIELQQAEQARLAAEAEAARRLEEQRQREAESRRQEEERVAEEARLREEQARNEAEAAEIARVERERAQAAERQRIEAERVEEEKKRLKERQRLAHEEAEHARLQRERSEMEVKLRLTQQELAEQRRLQAEKDAATDRARILLEQQLQTNMIRNSHIDDVFGSALVDSHQTIGVSSLYGSILKLRKRVASLNIKELSRPNLSSVLPTVEQSNHLNAEFTAIKSEVAALPASSDDPALNTQLKLLRLEIESLSSDVAHVVQLGVFLGHVEQCDTFLSDLLEHIDSYPEAPPALAASYRPSADDVPERQLSGRLEYTHSAIGQLTLAFAVVSDDNRVQSEHERVLQTWAELEEMARDKLTGGKSRPCSVVSSVSSVSSGRMSATSKRRSKAADYSKLSSRPSLGPPESKKTRRAFSSSMDPPERPLTSTRVYNRSTSGPLSFSPYGTTFASRQRTTSLTQSLAETPKRKTSGPIFTPKGRLRSESPVVSDSHSTSARSSTSTSTWSRAPRLSFASVPRATPQRNLPPRKTYVANPKNKLDVAVGDVMNNLPVGISIEGVSGSWKDQSGKYWIGDQDPKLCFCRILRSQTVMVRVGGGWTELSKFIRSHFADCFRLLDSPPYHDAPREEKWISSTTLLEAPEPGDSPAVPPKTPEPRESLPSFSLSTPTGSPHSLKSTPSTKGSPLMALQFMRRADPDAPILRPETPTKTPLRSRTTPINTPARNSIWRP